MPLLDEDVQINSTVTATLVGPVDVFHVSETMNARFRPRDTG